MKIVMCTYSANEKYVDACVAVLDELWIGHPEVIVFSDTGHFKYAKRVLGSRDGWVRMVDDCLDSSVAADEINPEEPLLLLLEDHVPHSPVDGELIHRLSTVLRASANTYLNLAGHGRGTQLSAVGGCSVHEMTLHTFSSLHPAIWSVAHLQATLAAAQAAGAETPWQFERLRLPEALHYTTGESVWHSPHGGFLWSGVVNRPALRTMRKGALRALRNRLLARYARELPSRILKRIQEQALAPAE